MAHCGRMWDSCLVGPGFDTLQGCHFELVLKAQVSEVCALALISLRIDWCECVVS
jgi:hypothetical protein